MIAFTVGGLDKSNENLLTVARRFASDQDRSEQWKRNIGDERLIEFVGNYSELHDFSTTNIGRMWRNEVVDRNGEEISKR